MRHENSTDCDHDPQNVPNSMCVMAFLSNLIAVFLLFSGCADHHASTIKKTNPIKTLSTIDQDTKTSLVVDRRNEERQNEKLATWVIGLDADMSSGSARSGDAIRRGIDLALEEVNQQGGLLGRKIELVIRDHRGNPDRGVDNLVEFSKMENLLAVVGGIHTPVALKELPVIHQEKIVYLGPWAAGTPVVSNGYEPNFVFRVSVRDEYAGGYLVEKAYRRNLKKMGLLLERTGWGRSNLQAITDAMNQRELEPVDVQWFNWGEKGMDSQIESILKKGADVVLLVSNSLEGTQIVKTMAQIDEAQRLPIISHWGISAGNFFNDTGEALSKVDITFIQSYSFLKPNISDKSKSLVKRYLDKFPECKSARDIYSPVGTAHAYEIVMMLIAAANDAGSTDSGALREALEDLEHFSGVIRDYSPPFRADLHDALNVNDFILCRFATDGAIVPEIE